MSNCFSDQLQSWTDWQNAEVIDPLDLIAYATLTTPPSTVDIGQYRNSTTFNVSTIFSTLKVTGVRVYRSGTPDTLLAVLTNPIAPLFLYAGDFPDIVEVDFYYPPDTLSVTGASFIVTAGGPPLPGTVSFVTAKTVRISLAAYLGLGNYTVRLNGTTIPTITWNGISLDGEPVGLPSGNNIAGTNFTCMISVVGGAQPPPPPQPPYGYWPNNPIALSSAPLCSALGTDNLSMVANASQWNVQHTASSIPGSTHPATVNSMFFLRCGDQWEMSVPLNLGTQPLPKLQLGFAYDAGSRGGCQGTIPVIQFDQRYYSGLVTLKLVLKRLGCFKFGLKADDLFGNSYMYQTTWKVVP